MRDVVSAVEGEYRRYKFLAEAAVAQLSDEELHRSAAGSGNSAATLMQHLGGNLASRFKDFLTSDGEKASRDREAEFTDQKMNREALFRMWEEGWGELFGTLASLSDEQLTASVTIRGTSLTIIEALARSLSHTSYHVGQIVLLARTIRSSEWKYLSIPPGGSSAYNQDPKLEKPPR
jgi:uncharacterized damage-inducible protein DinB